MHSSSATPRPCATIFAASTPRHDDAWPDAYIDRFPGATSGSFVALGMRPSSGAARRLAREARMIYGVGTDICDIRRIAATFARRGERFAEKVLGPHEIEVFRARRAKVEARGINYLATRFSAKEAFSKAIGMGMRMPMTWRDCELVKAPSGKPQIRLHGALSAWFEARGLHAHVSVSDETDYAASFVVVESKDSIR